MSNTDAIIIYAWMALGIVWLVTAFTSKRTVRRQSAGSRLMEVALGILAGVFLANIFTVGFLYKRFTPISPFSDAAGASLTLAGIAFSLWARFRLGRNWSGAVTLKQDHQLIRSGPYSIVRHPIYSGFLLALTGTAIARGTVSALIGVGAATVTLWLKSRTEEAFMTDQFGSEYLEYKREVKALIPFIW